MCTKNELLSVSSENEEEPPLDNGFEDEGKTLRCFKWSANSTKLLLSVRFSRDSDFENRTSTKKKLWDLIAADMFRIGGYEINGMLCNLKFRNMIHTYKKNRQKEISGQINLIVWEYYQQFKESFGDKYDGHRTTNLADLILHDETMMDTTNESSERLIDNQHSTNIVLEGNNTVNQTGKTFTDDNQPQVAMKRKISEVSFTEDEDRNNTNLPCSENVVSQSLTEEERQECAAFGNSVSWQLQNIKDSYTRALIKFKMQKILFLAQTGLLSSNNEQL